jgi:hypothetical protein
MCHILITQYKYHIAGNMETAEWNNISCMIWDLALKVDTQLIKEMLNFMEVHYHVPKCLSWDTTCASSI